MSTIDYGYRIRSVERQALVVRALRREMRRSDLDEAERKNLRDMIAALQMRIAARKRVAAAREVLDSD